jgi:Fe-S oxidoreductase
MEHAQILHRCFRCGYCKLPSSCLDLNCPAYLKYRFETYSPGGRMWLLRALLDGHIEASQRLAEILFSCAACGNCVEQCVFPKFKDYILEAFIEGREELVNAGVLPKTAKEYFESMSLWGNPFNLPQEERGGWAEGLNLEPYKDQDYLFYVGCVGAYDERGRRMARAVANLLRECGVSFGILGAEERCDGNEVRVMGEAVLFELLAKQNIANFEEAGVRKIVTLSPHAYHAFKNEYSKFGGAFEVYHYSQVLQQRTNQRGPAAAKKPLKVTFHDPCYLGRHNHEYAAPRRMLGALGGVELIEMDRPLADALCCGGGGGNFFTDVLGGGTDSASRVRVREAAATGAEVLAVACPKCAKMLDDAVKTEGLEKDLRVMDLAEVATTLSAPSAA